MNNKFMEPKKGTSFQIKCECSSSKHNKFMEPKKGTSFQIKRPAFRVGEQYTDKFLNAPELKPNRRSGLGNYDIKRNNFLAARVQGRNVIPFEKLDAMDRELYGAKVQLSSATLDKLFKVQIEDPNDVDWIREKDRRLRSGESLNSIKAFPPFGRPQRKISKMTNFGDLTLSLDDKIEQIQTAIVQGGAANTAERNIIMQNLNQILGNVTNIQKMTTGQFLAVKKSVEQMGIAQDWTKYFSQLGRIINGAVFNANKGPIVMFLLSNIPKGRTLNEPLLSWNSRTSVYAPVGILQLFQMGGKDRYLDLSTRTIDDSKSLFNKGIDVSKIDFTKIAPDPTLSAPGLMKVPP